MTKVFVTMVTNYETPVGIVKQSERGRTVSWRKHWSMKRFEIIYFVDFETFRVLLHFSTGEIIYFADFEIFRVLLHYSTG